MKWMPSSRADIIVGSAGLAGQEEIVASFRGGFGKPRRCAAGHDCDPIHLLGPVREDQRIAGGEPLANTRGELIDRAEASASVPPTPSSGERALHANAELTSEQRVVPRSRRGHPERGGRRQVSGRRRRAPATVPSCARRSRAARCSRGGRGGRGRAGRRSPPRARRARGSGETAQAIVATSSPPITCIPIGP